MQKANTRCSEVEGTFRNTQWAGDRQSLCPYQPSAKISRPKSILQNLKRYSTAGSFYAETLDFLHPGFRSFLKVQKAELK